MLFNKSKVRKINDKKILHKVGKHWVTVSIAMLATMGIGFAATGQAHHISMPATGVVAHASNLSNDTNVVFSGNATNKPENTKLSSGTTNDYNSNQSGNQIPDSSVVMPGNGYTTNNSTTHYADGAGSNAIIDSSNSGNVNINLVNKDNDTVKFNDDGTPVGNTSYLTGPDGYNYNLQDSDYSHAGLPANLANSSHHFTFNGGTHNIDISNHKYAATVEFKNATPALNDKKLSLNYNGEGKPNLNTSALNDLSANNLSINPEFSDIKSANDLKNGLSGFRIVPQNIHFDDYTLGGPYHYYEGGGDSEVDNDVDLVQDYDAKVTFYDQSGHQVGNQQVVDFGQSVPANYNNSQGISLYDLQQEGHFALPSGYVLGNGDNCPSTAISANTPVYFNGGTANQDKISNTGMNTMNISVTHNQNTETNTWRAAIQFVDKDGNPVGGVQNVDTGDSNINALKGTPSPGELYNQPFGNRPGFSGDSTNSGNNFLANNNSVKVPDGYSVSTSRDLGGSVLDATAGYVKFEKYTNPAVTDVEVTPNAEARVTLKDAATGQTVSGPTNVTLSGNDDQTVSAFDGSNNALNIPAGYNLGNGFNSTGGNPVTGLENNDKLITTSIDSTNNAIHDSNVPNDVVLVNKNNTATAHAAIQFMNKGIGYPAGNPVVVDMGTNYPDDKGPNLGQFLSEHNIIPSGYQLDSSDSYNTPVNYSNSEVPTVTHVDLVPKSSNTYHAAVQFKDQSNDNVGAPVMIDTGATSSYGLAKDYDDAQDGKGSFLHQYNLAQYVPKGYEIVATGSGNTDTTGINYDTSAGVDGFNYNVVTVKPVNAPTTNANSNNNNQPSNQKHDVNSTDVNNAAKNDPQLQNALNAFNAKNGNTKDNANALVNAIKNNSSLNNANNNLNNIINTIKNAENNPSNHGNLDNLLKLYNLYMGLVNSGLFNN